MLLTAEVPALALSGADLILGFGDDTDLHWEVFGRVEELNDRRMVVKVTIHYALPDGTEGEHEFTDLKELVTVQLPRHQTSLITPHGVAA